MYFTGNKVQPAGGESPAQAVEGILSLEQQRACVLVKCGGVLTGSGVLIHPRVVLTAAHVVRNEDGSLITPFHDFIISVTDYGTLDYGFPTIRQWARVQDMSEVFQGAPWNQIDLLNYGNDVALLWLEAPIQTWAAMPLPLGITPPVGAECILGGFSPWAERVQRGFGRFKLIERELTGVELLPATTAAERPGDSGGPAIQVTDGRPAVFGVVSASRKTPDGPIVSIVSRTDTLTGWIHETIESWTAGGRSPLAEPPAPPSSCEERWALWGPRSETWAGGACAPPVSAPTEPVPVEPVPAELTPAPPPPTNPQPPPSGPGNRPAKPPGSGWKTLLYVGGALGLLGLGLWWWKRRRA